MGFLRLKTAEMTFQVVVLKGSKTLTPTPVDAVLPQRGLAMDVFTSEEQCENCVWVLRNKMLKVQIV